MVGGATLLYILYEIDFQLIFLANEYALLYITTLVVTIIGYPINQNSLTSDLQWPWVNCICFLEKTDNCWKCHLPNHGARELQEVNNLWNNSRVILLIFGVFLVFIIRTYFINENHWKQGFSLTTIFWTFLIRKKGEPGFDSAQPPILHFKLY